MRRTFVLGIVWLLGVSQHSSAVEISFNRDIRPILADRCFHCHGPDEADRKADLRLDLETDFGRELFSPGDASESELIRRITSSDPEEVMPPPEAHKKTLTPQEVELFRAWVDQGAVYESYWAFRRIERPEMPKVENEQWCVNPIDFFVLRKQEQAGVEFSPRADRRTLIRRLALDLTGLPPTRDEIERFVQDSSAEAYETIVDFYLQKPQYGEHMARYWLDLVRFADTNGIHHDHYRDLSPYRGWVIEAFNSNLSYDSFVRDQLAGDLVEQPEKQQLVASGFNRLHMIIDRGTMLPEESLARNVIDRVTSVGTAFMGLTVGCAVCHDHKYDPITSKEFFQLYAFFNNLDATPETGGRSGTDFRRGLQKPYINLPSEEQALRQSQLGNEKSEVETQIQTLKQWLAANPLPSTEGGPSDSETNGNRDVEDSVAEEEELVNHRQEKETEIKTLEAKSKELSAAMDSLMLEIPAAMVMKERTERRPSHIMIRGAYDNLGEEVQRGTPAFLPPLQESKPGAASRLDFADWLVSRDHPLTARVTVNRFWQQLFGVGLVKTSEDLGGQGEWPSHPDLLDYLAWQFIDSGWDVKSLMKQMVMSQTYQQQSEASEEAFQSDPDNRLLTRGSRYRLDAEVIRDQMLATSGLLNFKIGGKSVKPPQPEGLWKSVALPSSFPNQFVADQGTDVYRRSVYTFWKRGLPPPQMTILNAPAREDCVARRERTNTPLQALLLMNEQQAMDAARALALKFHTDKETLSIVRMYETITGQEPDEDELKTLQDAFHGFLAYYSENPSLAKDLVEDVLPDGQDAGRLAAWTMLVNAVFNLDVAKTRS